MTVFGICIDQKSGWRLVHDFQQPFERSSSSKWPFLVFPTPVLLLFVAAKAIEEKSTSTFQSYRHFTTLVKTSSLLEDYQAHAYEYKILIVGPN
ncbi:unnamed protein product, partial [Mesorhabditis belari]|uniref:Uncharacterized protein n=1 Tax=Mesorhabditis belari TaxID=2138241 RepID=A0AAF3FET0_9BILA